MPYIKYQRREELWDEMGYHVPTTSGELNYMFSQLCRNYIDTQGLNYQNINDIVGALEGAKQEFYRRVVVPHENKKILENGDIYE